MLLGVHLFGFFFMYPYPLSCWHIRDTSSWACRGGLKITRKDSFKYDSCALHDVTEGSASAMQLNVHNGLAKNFSPSPLKDIVNNSSMLINKDLKKLSKRNSGYNTTRDFHGKCDDKQ